ncbi:MAG TPA: MIP/aquaporin family protein [Vicinamibacterales bacterium]|nr:MIP/aquaporin family protein [Vicinamibacterales bacterium]
MTSPVLGEFMGTLILILLGDGVVAGVLLKHSKSENSGWIVIATGWALAVMAGVFTAMAFGSPDTHLNPAVTLGVAVATGDFSKVVPYSVAQLAGAFAGAVLVWLHYLPHWKLTTDANAKLGVFCTAPAIRHTGANLTSEIIGTFVLVLVAAAIFSERVAVAGPAPGLGPFLVGSLVWGIGLSLGGPTGYAINPARDLGPRLAHALLPIPGKRDADWSYAAVPIAGPLAGAAVAGLIAKIVGL